MIETINADASEPPEKSALQRKVERLIKKAEKQGYKFTSMNLNMFEALGRENWDEDKVNFLAIKHFEGLYQRIYSVK